jgi:hypothetical protein
LPLRVFSRSTAWMARVVRMMGTAEGEKDNYCNNNASPLRSSMKNTRE